MQTENEIRNLTGIRAFAALWVLIYHWRGIDALDAAPILHSSAIIGRGYWAVDLFFVLSGFIIGMVYHQKLTAKGDFKSWRNYLILRVGRLYPIHFVIFLAYLALFVVSAKMGQPMGKDNEYTWPQAIAHLTLTQGWKIVDGLSWNWPSWSISAEFFAYALLFPVYFTVLRRVGWIAATALLTVIWLAAYGYGQTSGHGFKTYDSGLLRISAEFLCGYMLFFASRAVPFSSRDAERLFIGSIVAMMVLCFLPETMEVFLLPCLAGVIFSLYIGSPRLNRIFGNAKVVYLGHISYALYMVHDLVNLVTSQALGMLGLKTPLSPSLALGLMLVLLLISQVAAALGFHLVENPARSWLKRRLTAAKPDLRQAVKGMPWHLAAPIAACVYYCCCHQVLSCEHHGMMMGI